MSCYISEVPMVWQPCNSMPLCTFASPMEQLQVTKFLLWLKKRNQRLPDHLVVQCRVPVCPCLAWPTRYKTQGQCSVPVGMWDDKGRYSCSLAEPLRVMLPEGCRRVKVKLRKGSHTVATFKAPTGETFCTSTQDSIGVLFYCVGLPKSDDEHHTDEQSGDDDDLASEKCDDDDLASEKCDDDGLASEESGDGDTMANDKRDYENLDGAKCDEGVLGARARRMTFDEKYEVDGEDYVEDPSPDEGDWGSDSSGRSEDLASQEDDDSTGYMECFYPENYEKSFLTEETAHKLASRMYDCDCSEPEEPSDLLDHATLILAVVGAVVMFLLPWAFRALFRRTDEEEEPLIDL